MNPSDLLPAGEDTKPAGDRRAPRAPRPFEASPALAVVVLLTVFVPAWYWTTSRSMVLKWWTNRKPSRTDWSFSRSPCGWSGAAERSSPRCRCDRRSGRSRALGLAGFAWLLGALGDAVGVQQARGHSMIVLAIVATAGMDVTRVLAFPLLFLFFAVPFGEFMLPYLMELTADSPSPRCVSSAFRSTGRATTSASRRGAGRWSRPAAASAISSHR